jgi:hypothetical protein
MKWILFLAQTFPTPTAGEFFTFMGCVALIVGGVATFYKIKADKKRSEESNEPRRTILPSPLLTKPAEEFVSTLAFAAQIKRRDEELKAMEDRIEKRIDAHEEIVRDRFHKLSNEVHAATTEAKNGREIATEQFQAIEGRLGEVKSSLQHMTAQQDHTERKLDRMVENLPESIAKAIDRARPQQRR